MFERLQSALDAAGLDGLAIFAGRALLPPRHDVPLPFRAEPYFVSWLPLPHLQGAILVLSPGETAQLIYPCDADFWHAPPAPPSGYWVEHFDIRFAESESTALKLAAESARGFAAIGAAVPALPELGPINPEGLLRELDYRRALKTDYEVACMARANAIAARGHRAVARAFGPETSEFDLHQVYLSATRLREQEFPYQNIVAVNEHAAILHYQHLATEPPPAIRTLLIDAGAQFAGYAADVTRTWVNGAGEFDEFQHLVDSMEALQQSICAEVAPGVDFVELDERMHRGLAEILVAHELVACDSDQAFASGLTRLFLPHGLGHFLGLQVHDPGGWQSSADGNVRPPPDDNPYLRLTRRLEAGMALTIEPGIYFIPALLEAAAPARRRMLDLEKIERFRACGGIRIEDNLLVESTQSRNLTREAFATLGVDSDEHGQRKTG